MFQSAHCVTTLPVFQAKDGLSMKNFLRALRYVIPYRRRLALSIICALLGGGHPLGA